MESCDIDEYDRKEWFKDNNKLVVVRYKERYQGSIIGAFRDDNAALDYMKIRMEREGKTLILLELIGVTFYGYVNRCNDTYRHKFIKNVCFRDLSGGKETETNFWFEIIDNYINH
ncbi:hypothetical protein GC105_16170 [Alkalibaculum sp. M08DMB]|uniref:Uncharacterized protein n=1 Tax=Alkalibaculum sporogenes TaxID=2655001 RepID=A0A6A7KD71_9FIRM|nr:hypothetical protein [Alkalibaculum sporogenes]MPW27302.1 hypothetical protein [Alkalibaculum sporogenes]